MAFAYLTIDDAPSADFERKVSFLRARGVPAVFFCIGEQLDRHSTAVVDAIRCGFVIANHSYSHRQFSQLSLTESIDEIAATDAIIERLYDAAGQSRPVKLFRYPYGDRGRRAPAVNRYLSKTGYVGLRIPDPRLPFPFVRGLRFRNADSWWTFDLRDWCLADRNHQHPIHSGRDVIDRLDRELAQTRWRIGSNHVFLSHDHVETAELFTTLIGSLLSYGIVFELPPRIDSTLTGY